MKQEPTKLDAIQLSILCKELAMFFKEGIPLYDASLWKKIQKTAA